MPELPEVEITLRGITQHLTSQTITKVVLRRNDLRWPIPHDISNLSGSKIQTLDRRGKYILIGFDHGTMMIHLGMSGTLRIATTEMAPRKHDHADFHLSNGKILRFNDPRRFGAILWADDVLVHPLLSSLGLEPLTDEFTGKTLHDASRQRTSNIKSLIMDSHVVVGVGNIYANEALFLSGIHPKRAANRIAAARYDALSTNIKRILEASILQGGTSLKDFTHSDGKPGYFKQFLRIYGREGLPCINCGKTIKRILLVQRSTYYCPKCQH